MTIKSHHSLSAVTFNGHDKKCILRSDSRNRKDGTEDVGRKENKFDLLFKLLHIINTSSQTHYLWFWKNKAGWHYHQVSDLLFSIFPVSSMSWTKKLDSCTHTEINAPGFKLLMRWNSRKALKCTNADRTGSYSSLTIQIKKYLCIT